MFRQIKQVIDARPELKKDLPTEQEQINFFGFICFMLGGFVMLMITMIFL